MQNKTLNITKIIPYTPFEIKIFLKSFNVKILIKLRK